MNTKLTTKGFTIIEVVLVLAIAGLIFLMVFVALPALQSGQRDTARKSDASTVLSAVNTYMAGNRGLAPTTTTLTGNATGAKGKFVQEVSSNTTTVTVQTFSTATPYATVSDGQVVVTLRAKCGATGAGASAVRQTLVAGTANQYTVSTWLEGGNGVTYCAQS